MTTGKGLLFIVSQPRSGSTVLQRLLTNAPAVMGSTEPWFLLHLFAMDRPGTLATEYNAQHALRGLDEFRELAGQDVWTEAVRAAAGVLYGRALASGDATTFVDKTPRYHLVLDELRTTFPDAAIVLLTRNPLDVLSSIWMRHSAGSWAGLARRDRRLDLVAAPAALAAAARDPRPNEVLVHYDDLVRSPEPTLRGICDIAGLEFDPRMLAYGDDSVSGLGDQWAVADHAGPVTDHVDAWRGRLTQPWHLAFAAAHLRGIGGGVLADLGHDLEALLAALGPVDSVATRRGEHRWELVATDPDDRSPAQRLELEAAHSAHQRGGLRTVGALGARLVGRGRSTPPEWGVRLR